MLELHDLDLNEIELIFSFYICLVKLVYESLFFIKL